MTASAPLHNQFTFFSANMEHFMPMVPPSEHEVYFRGTMYHRRLSRLDLSYAAAGYLPTIVGWDAAWVDSLRQEPAIIACAHMGAHMLIGMLLAKAGAPLAVLVAEHLVPALTEIWKTAARTDPSLRLPLIVDTGPKTSLRRLMNLAKSGVSLLVYWDGEEHGGKDDRQQAVCVPLLGQHIVLRRGIPFLARATGLPIYPLTAFRQQDGSVGVHHGRCIRVEDYRGPDFFRYTMQAVVDGFSSSLIHFPAQWNKWTHLHRMVFPEHFFVESGKKLSNRYGILQGDDAYFLFARRDYQAVALPQKEVDRLCDDAKKRTGNCML
ncbi:lipid A biosynthesis acyltransferase [Parapedobacter koreensis]|uniref:Lipid A biosynthesis acyltransferase n=2 Tax=Parapedobacter koreensis TaxID=332977 RepID=A0A1H7NKH0_9SPHI|nr:lipid A biosynthesis acyltransferase [Parapedobacter koreensis]